VLIPDVQRLTARQKSRCPIDPVNQLPLQFIVRENHGCDRHDYPIRVGLPIAQGAFQETELPNVITSDDGRTFRCQSVATSYWPSGSPRWILLSANIQIQANQQTTFSANHTVATVHCEQEDSPFEYAAGDAQTRELFHLSAPATSPPITAKLHCTGAEGQVSVALISDCQTIERGPICTNHHMTGKFKGKQTLSFFADLTYFPSTATLKLDIALHNPQRAKHPDGYWDLGDPNSEYLQSATLEIDTRAIAPTQMHWQESIDAKWQTTTEMKWSITQTNSGGENWDSRTHVDKDNQVIKGKQGYHLEHGDTESLGNRATPTVVVQSNSAWLLATMPEFWQKCPSGIEVSDAGIKIHLLATTAGLTELQPGEKCSRTLWLQASNSPEPHFEATTVNIHQALTVLPHESTIAASDAIEWYAADPTSSAPTSSDNNATDSTSHEQQLLNELLSGPTSFFWKREQIDEYGWRNFGDFWADHEELYSEDSSPVISHYNNQYDLLHGLLREYLRTQDPRWWDLAKPLAEHIISIDVYDTDRDRAAYNGGLFWHTSHYRDASTATHRTYSVHMVGEKHAVNGGGPSNEHNFTTGLLLYYHLTGSRPARRTILKLADWVIAMDNGGCDLLAPLSQQTTGSASSTRDWDYHGPGRGIGNSINALIDAWQLTHADPYLEFCIELVHRCVHPLDDIEALNLNDSENRWSYPIALQALLRFISVVGNEAPKTCEHLRHSLRHFGKWMLDHSLLHFESPEELEFPTETWAAQDLRKGTTMMLIGSMGTDAVSQQMHDKGLAFYETALEQLMSFPSRNCTRPAAIALQQFPIRWFAQENHREHADNPGTPATTPANWPERIPIATQKVEIRGRMRSPAGLVKIAKNACSPAAWVQSAGEFKARFLGQDRFFRVNVRR